MNPAAIVVGLLFVLPGCGDPGARPDPARPADQNQDPAPDTARQPEPEAQPAAADSRQEPRPDPQADPETDPEVASEDPPSAVPQDGAKPPDAGAAVAAAMELFAREGIEVDLANKRVIVACVMNNPVDTIEFALVHRRGKTHEGLLYTEAQPSVINAALMTVGFTPGVNVAYDEMDPLPTHEEVRLGAQYLEVFPPRGMTLYMTVRWRDAAGEQRELVLEDMMFDLATGREVQDVAFVYLGGRMDSIHRGEAPVFFADVEGNLISTVYREPANHLGTIVHSHAAEQERWWLTSRCPEPGTAVELVFHREETDLHRARQERLAARGPEAVPAPRGPSEGPTEAGSAGHDPVDPVQGGK